MSNNVMYAQSGGVTAVINAQAAGLIAAISKDQDKFGKIYAARNGIIGVLHQDVVDLSSLANDKLSALAATPGGAFGSCRYKLQSAEDYAAILKCFQELGIKYFFYNGGNDSQDTTHKIAEYCKQQNHEIICIGIPKTIDNDLAGTDCCPGFGSAAKYLAISTLEASLDLKSMSYNSTKVFILETMGRHAGWLAASTGVIKQQNSDAPHIILVPELKFDPANFLKTVDNTIAANGYCVIVASEGIRDHNGEFVASSNSTDLFGHSQLGGVAAKLAALITSELKHKCHYAIADYLQRAARHIASQTDVDQAYATGKAAAELASKGLNGVMPTIVRSSNSPYTWQVDSVELTTVANQEKFLPRDFLSADGYSLTPKAIEYFLPLIQGEAYPEYNNGLPTYLRSLNT